MKTWCVYLHRNSATSQVFYVGIGSSLKRPHERRRSQYWHHYVNKHGYPIVEILYQGLTERDAKDREIFLIASYKRRIDGGSLVNVTLGGDDQPMRHASVVAKVVAARKLQVVSVETRAKMSASAKKRSMSKAHAGAARKRATGYHPMQSAEARRKVSLATRGRKRSLAHRMLNGLAHSQPINQWTREGEFIAWWPTMQGAAHVVGCTPENISSVLHGKTQTAKGFVWSRAGGLGLPRNQCHDAGAIAVCVRTVDELEAALR